jgi:NAD(P) transhydrogenase
MEKFDMVVIGSGPAGEKAAIRTEHVIQKELEVIQDKLFRNGISVLGGRGRIISPNQVEVEVEQGKGRTIETDVIVIATGSRPYREPSIEFDDTHIFDGETILKLDRIPQSMIIIGGGVIGSEYACIFAHLGVKVTMVESKERLMPFLDHEISDTLTYLMRKHRIKVIFDDKKESIEIKDNQVLLTTRSGRKLYAETLLVAMGRVGNTSNLGIEELGIKTNKRGLIRVDENFHTGAAKIYAVGDVIGFPSLASVSMDQGRLATRHAFGLQKAGLNALLPYGIYTIPEVSIVGATEESLNEQGLPFETGVARFYELARGQIAGDHDGVLKLIFDPDTKKLLGVHIIGERAADMIHVGQAVISFGGTIDYFVDTVFNFPTMSEAYKAAALNGLNSIQ